MRLARYDDDGPRLDPHACAARQWPLGRVDDLTRTLDLDRMRMDIAAARLYGKRRRTLASLRVPAYDVLIYMDAL
ncbi:MAG TPA: hypothetical protein VMF09_04975 [Solirubrobacteraceae bacterium]|nr:hypothetical protein [Solirubrobacteraceae bacterium]